MRFDFKKYHYRSMNAANEAEREAINQELKDLYASLSAADQKIFNEDLKEFLVKQYADISSSYESIKDTKSTDE